jgi:hypothetical protein
MRVSVRNKRVADAYFASVEMIGVTAIRSAGV